MNHLHHEHVAHDWSVYWQTADVFMAALITAAALAVAGAVVGLFVLLRRESLMALALPNVVAIGAALALRLAWPPLPPALGAVAVALLLVVWTKRRQPESPLLPAIYVAGLCLSILLIADSGQHLAEVEHMFTGIDLFVEPGQAQLAVPVLLLIGVTCALLWRRWLLIAQSPVTADLAGLNPARWDVLFLLHLAVLVVIGTSTLGVVMVVAMLFLPATAVLPWVRRIPPAMVLSIAVALASLGAGFFLSVRNNWPLSQSVGAAGLSAAIISQVAARVLHR